jgi:hypothetical protein
MCYTEDGQDLAAAVRKLLELEPVSVRQDDGVVPNVWEQVVFLFLLTEKLLEQEQYAERAAALAGENLPVVPVVPDLGEFHFNTIPATHTILGARNAVGLQPGDGEAVKQAVRGYAGLESFALDKRVFVSYRRSDAQEVADAVEQYLWSQRFQVFLDTQQVPAGADVQPIVMEQLRDKDFVLLIDSPDAGTSEWVIAEITEAIRQRIPICALCLDSNVRHVPLSQDAPVVLWEPDNPHNLQRLALAVSRGIAARRSLDDRMERTIKSMAELLDVDAAALGSKRLLLRGNDQRVLVEYETNPVSLERLHRLYLAYKEQSTCNLGLYVCGDITPLPLTDQAVAWARAEHPLRVMPISEIYPELKRHFAEGANT